MIPAAFLLFISPITLHLPLLKTAFQWSRPLHHLCMALVPPSPWQQGTASLVCGAPWNDSRLYSALQTLGLLHLMVVSGSHLAVLLFIWEKYRPLKKSRWVSWVFLALMAYCFVTRFQPPVVRAFLQLVLSTLADQQKLFWRSDQRVFVSGCLCLFLFPQWWISLSLLLSWGASLALTIPSPFTKPQASLLPGQRHGWQCICVYLLLFPLLLPIGSQSPMTIFSNWLLAPFLSLVLFPLSLVTLALPPLTPLTDAIWQVLLWLAPQMEAHFPPSSLPQEIAIHWLWGYLFTLHAGLHFFRLVRTRKANDAH